MMAYVPHMVLASFTAPFFRGSLIGASTACSVQRDRLCVCRIANRMLSGTGTYKLETASDLVELAAKQTGVTSEAPHSHTRQLALYM